DSVSAGNGGGDGNNASGVCNAATADHQCAQANTALVIGDAANLAQTNQISGRDSVADGAGGGYGDNASGVCNAATADHQCAQANTALVIGDVTNLTQTNQISGRDSVAGVTGAGTGDGN